ncbi:MAG: hypothetical protein EXS58_04950 [Candidatus Latescibacteria bacterium]|nr:hypothetical protein [Candidatus Latescibacterota bacterium]
MKTTFAIFTLATLLWASTTLAGQPNPPPPQVIEGNLVDLGCYVMDMSGTKHAKCGMQCALKGLPVGLIEEKTGKVYTVLLPSPGLALYMEKGVRITGTVSKEHLLSPEKMEVQEGEAWKTVELPSAM